VVEGFPWVLLGGVLIVFRAPIARLEGRVNRWGESRFPARPISLLGVTREARLRLLNVVGGVVFLAVGVWEMTLGSAR
jgi:hypothetical protein